MQQNPELASVLGIAGTVTLNMASNLIYDVVKRVIGRNIGKDDQPQSDLMKQLLGRRDGDIEALVAATEPSVRQSHSVIGNGAQIINIYGGSNVINKYDQATREYVVQNVEDREVHRNTFSVAAFNANSGHGSVFDFKLGRTIPIGMSREILREVSSVFSWGLDQYANRTDTHVSMKCWRILAMDGTPKRYVVVGAEKTDA
jgi:hypothetical protein